MPDTGEGAVKGSLEQKIVEMEDIENMVTSKVEHFEVQAELMEGCMEGGVQRLKGGKIMKILCIASVSEYSGES